MTTILKKIPFVNGVPDDGQKSIRWVINGELLGGSTTKKGFDGVLNAAPSQIQENIVVLDENIKTLGSDIANTDIRLTKVEDFIDQSESDTLIETVNQHTTKIDILDDKVEENSNVLSGLSLDVINTKNEIGVKTSLNGETIYKDLVFIKERIGSKSGEDVNGIPNPENIEPTGLIKRVDDINNQAVVNRNDIQFIKNELEINNISKLKQDSEKYRQEIGDVDMATSSSIYQRLKNIDDYTSKNSTDMATIKQSIGFSDGVDVVDELDTLTTKSDQYGVDINDPTNGLKKKVADISNQINDPATGILKNISDMKLDHTQTDEELSNVSTKVNSLESFVGIGVAGDGSLSKKLEELTAIQNDTAASLQDLQSIVGNGQTGLIKDVNDLKTTVADLTRRLEILESK